MLKAQELRDKSVEELNATLLDIKREIFTMQNTRKISMKTDMPHLFRSKRHDIARINTVLNEKKRLKQGA
jgi:large subunit ribosomal protein L29